MPVTQDCSALLIDLTTGHKVLASGKPPQCTAKENSTTCLLCVQQQEYALSQLLEISQKPLKYRCLLYSGHAEWRSSQCPRQRGSSLLPNMYLQNRSLDTCQCWSAMVVHVKQMVATTDIGTGRLCLLLPAFQSLHAGQQLRIQYLPNNIMFQQQQAQLYHNGTHLNGHHHQMIPTLKTQQSIQNSSHKENTEPSRISDSVRNIVHAI